MNKSRYKKLKYGSVLAKYPYTKEELERFQKNNPDIDELYRQVQTRESKLSRYYRDMVIYLYTYKVAKKMYDEKLEEKKKQAEEQEAERNLSRFKKFIRSAKRGLKWITLQS